MKFFGVALGVSGGLCGGKEVVHMGSIIAHGCAYIPLRFTHLFRNDYEKRKLMAIGTAAGISANFGSPIGGALFAYEISKPSSFWTFSLHWRVFFGSAISAFTAHICKQVYAGNFPITFSTSETIILPSSSQ